MRMKFLCIICAAVAAASCSGVQIEGKLAGVPDIYPDYADVTVPANIAPLNFSYVGEGKCCAIVESEGKTVTVKSRGGLVAFSPREWKGLTCPGQDIKITLAVRKEGRWMAYEPFSIHVSSDTVDPYISYRLIPPGYQGWKTMGIYQRSLESYRQRAILENRLSGENCINCHTYCQRNPGRMLFHARADFGGTFVIDGKNIEKLNTKTDSTVSALVYPYWHPEGRYVAFSVNATKQSFFNHDPNRIEVFDSASDVVVYDTKTHIVSWSPLTKSPEMFETFPTFSPDGKWLYFCSSKAVGNMPYTYKEAHYGIYRIAFNAEDGALGDSLECVYDAEGMSASFPRISPDGKYLCFTKHAYGNFSIWHHDADLWIIDLEDGSSWPLDGANSDDVDSYHDWDSSGKWMLFSSRRDDGLYTRLYIAHIDGTGHASKAFMLPQKDPKSYYQGLMDSYNIPEFMTGPVTLGKRSIANTMRETPGTDIKVK